MASSKPQRQRRGGKKNRKHRRNYRWDYKDHTITKYRMRHGINGDVKRGKAKN